eukprot:TRINITY_DN3799_c0_g1_i1.p1 TRINITY_DN3799_c0_g1~~TRINITY_DN3799_c0_g1_i1.p1  ORF type:complete len:170 (+),score=18.68 TRINITY_DN3799_c0_g1_i1:87-596(+)
MLALRKQQAERRGVKNHSDAPIDERIDEWLDRLGSDWQRTSHATKQRWQVEEQESFHRKSLGELEASHLHVQQQVKMAPSRYGGPQSASRGTSSSPTASPQPRSPQPRERASLSAPTSPLPSPKSPLKPLPAATMEWKKRELRSLPVEKQTNLTDLAMKLQVSPAKHRP